MDADPACATVWSVGAMGPLVMKFCPLGSLQKYLCRYFSAASDCSREQGKSISPMGATKSGGKCLKVRWIVTGRGKSGGLRMRSSRTAIGSWLRW